MGEGGHGQPVQLRAALVSAGRAPAAILGGLWELCQGSRWLRAPHLPGEGELSSGQGCAGAWATTGGRQGLVLAFVFGHIPARTGVAAWGPAAGKDLAKIPVLIP